MLTRRQLLINLGAGSLAAPFAAFAQQPGKVWRLGHLGENVRLLAGPDPELSGAILQALRDLGYVEGKNLSIEWRYAGRKLDRLPELAAELVRLKVDVIFASTPAAVQAAQQATSTIPIVMGAVADPVGQGLVKSLARPGGNVTGPANISAELGAKRLEMLRAMLPRVSRLAVLRNPASPNLLSMAAIESAAAKLRFSLLRVEAGTPQELEAAFSRMASEGVGALSVVLNAFFQQQRRQIASLALKHRLPAMTADRIYTQAGCLMSYGSSITDDYRRAAVYVAKLFKGAKPADLPVEEPTKIELVINGKTAKALGLVIPKELLQQANRVIE